jgi:hypothetical protein
VKNHGDHNHPQLVTAATEHPGGRLIYLDGKYQWRVDKDEAASSSHDCDTTADDISALTFYTNSSKSTKGSGCSISDGQKKIGTYPPCNKGQARQVRPQTYLFHICVESDNQEDDNDGRDDDAGDDKLLLRYDRAG